MTERPTHPLSSLVQLKCVGVGAGGGDLHPHDPQQPDASVLQ